MLVEFVDFICISHCCVWFERLSRSEMYPVNGYKRLKVLLPKILYMHLSLAAVGMFYILEGISESVIKDNLCLCPEGAT